MEKYILCVFAVYLIIINIVGWVLPIIDKKRAENQQWRIKERTLFIVSAFGGSAAMLLSMKKYRHKTRHKRFMIGIPLIITVQILLLASIIYVKNASCP